MTTDYVPIACAAYDEIEILAMRRARVDLLCHDDRGREIRHAGQVVDTAVHDGAEFLVLQEGDRKLEIRLDRIARLADRDSGKTWPG
jgi:transcriptional antiterminator Rof (Rho-off)